MRTHPEDYTVGWICAIEIERVVACAALDEEYTTDKQPTLDVNDRNSYNFGRINDHHVVIAGLPHGRYGITSAAEVASHMNLSFPWLQIRLMVGIAGGAPSKKRDIRLGDVVVSTPTSKYGGVLQYDFGKAIQNQEFEITNQLAPIPADLLNALGNLKAQHKAKGHKIEETLASMVEKYPRIKEVCRKPSIQDKLYQANYLHLDNPQCDCQSEDEVSQAEDRENAILVSRHERKQDEDNPAIHHGLVASANSLMKNAIVRDALADKYEVLCFEMEAAGLMNSFPCVVIRGICDYSDTHKNDMWQGYAAATAAAYAKELLCILSKRPTPLPSHHSEQNSTLVKPRYVIPLELRGFVGREDELDDMERNLLTEDTGIRQFAIYGLGGVGKTRLALRFCYNLKARGEYSIFWVSALSTARFKQDFVKIAKTCSLPTDQEADVITIVQEYLSSETAGKWLLVVDNADDKSMLFDDGLVDQLPQSQAGITLFTTRYKEIAIDLANGDTLALGEMSHNEAERFFTQSLRRKDLGSEIEAGKYLLEVLTYLPLAITQAASYILKTSITISEYLALIKASEQEMMNLLSRETRDRTRESQDPVAVTWLVTFKQIRTWEPLAAELLFFLAFLENKAIPRSILPLDQSHSDGDLTHAIGVLIGYSFLTRQGDEEYDMHRLVHRTIKSWMQKEDIVDIWEMKTVNHLAQIFPVNDWKNRSLWQQYTPHAIRVLERTKHLSNADRATLCLDLGLSLREDGRRGECLAWVSECVSWQILHLPEADRNRLRSQRFLSRLNTNNGQVELAIEQLTKLIAVQERVFTHDDEDLLDSRSALAFAYLNDGKIDVAIRILENVVAIRERMPAEDYGAATRAQYDLALAYRRDRRTTRAIELFEKVIAVEQRTLAEDHPNLRKSQAMLARAYLDNNETQRAIAVLEKINVIEENLLSEIHPDRLMSLHLLARAYTKAKRVKEAISLLENVVGIEARVLAEDHPDRLISQDELARAYSVDRRIREAISLQEKVVGIRARVVAEDHPDLLTSQHNLALMYEEDEQYERGVSLMQHVVAIQGKSLPNDHLDRFSSETALSGMLQEQADRDVSKRKRTNGGESLTC